MAIKVVKTPKEGYKFTPRLEKGKDDAFSVWIKPISPRVLMDLEDRMVQRKGDDVFIAQGMVSFQMALHGVTGWENMLDTDDKPVAFGVDADGVAKEDTISKIPLDMIIEIANVIGEITRDPSSIQLYFHE